MLLSMSSGLQVCRVLTGRSKKSSGVTPFGHDKAKPTSLWVRSSADWRLTRAAAGEAEASTKPGGGSNPGSGDGGGAVGGEERADGGPICRATTTGA